MAEIRHDCELHGLSQKPYCEACHNYTCPSCGVKEDWISAAMTFCFIVAFLLGMAVMFGFDRLKDLLEQ